MRRTEEEGANPLFLFFSNKHLKNPGYARFALGGRWSCAGNIYNGQGTARRTKTTDI